MKLVFLVIYSNCNNYVPIHISVGDQPIYNNMAIYIIIFLNNEGKITKKLIIFDKMIKQVNIVFSVGSSSPILLFLCSKDLFFKFKKHISHLCNGGIILSQYDKKQ